MVPTLCLIGQKIVWPHVSCQTICAVSMTVPCAAGAADAVLRRHQHSRSALPPKFLFVCNSTFLLGSIRELYASSRHGGGKAGAIIGAGGEADEVEPAQIVV